MKTTDIIRNAKALTEDEKAALLQRVTALERSRETLTSQAFFLYADLLTAATYIISLIDDHWSGLALKGLFHDKVEELRRLYYDRRVQIEELLPHSAIQSLSVVLLTLAQVAARTDYWTPTVDIFFELAEEVLFRGDGLRQYCLQMCNEYRRRDVAIQREYIDNLQPIYELIDLLEEYYPFEQLGIPGVPETIDFTHESMSILIDGLKDIVDSGRVATAYETVLLYGIDNNTPNNEKEAKS